jgi:hypothetical protein
MCAEGRRRRATRATATGVLRAWPDDGGSVRWPSDASREGRRLPRGPRPHRRAYLVAREATSRWGLRGRDSPARCVAGGSDPGRRRSRATSRRVVGAGRRAPSKCRAAGRVRRGDLVPDRGHASSRVSSMRCEESGRRAPLPRRPRLPREGRVASDIARQLLTGISRFNGYALAHGVRSAYRGPRRRLRRWAFAPRGPDRGPAGGHSSPFIYREWTRDRRMRRRSRDACDANGHGARLSRERRAPWRVCDRPTGVRPGRASRGTSGGARTRRRR